MASSEPVPELTILVCGPSGVGKSALVQRYLYGVFPPEFDPIRGAGDRQRVEVDGKPHLVEIHRSNRIEAAATTELLIQRADAFLLVYRVGSRASYEEMRVRHRLVVDRRGGGVPVMLVGNKCDLGPEMRAVSPEEGARLAGELGCGFAETSAKDDVNVESTFAGLIRAHKGGMGNELGEEEVTAIKGVKEDERLSLRARVAALFRRVVQKARRGKGAW